MNEILSFLLGQSLVNWSPDYLHKEINANSCEKTFFHKDLGLNRVLKVQKSLAQLTRFNIHWTKHITKQLIPMQGLQDFSRSVGLNSSTAGNGTYSNFKSQNNNSVETESKIIGIPNEEDKRSTEKFLVKDNNTKNSKRTSVQNQSEADAFEINQKSKDLFRLFVKNGEYVYARPNDIIMMESCDHLVKVYVAFSDKIKKTVRHDTLKDFLLQLPKTQFLRIGRFCAINTDRLSGGNYLEQILEFDFKITVRLKHPISQGAFGKIGK